MSFYGQILERAVLPVGDAIAGGNFLQKLRQYRKEQWLSARELHLLQKSRLARILEFARVEVPFYEGLQNRSNDPFEDIKRYPQLTKAIVKENSDALLARPKETLIAESSSGSSGIQGTVYMDKAAQASQRAMQMLWFEWCGYNIGDSVLQTGITPNRGFIKTAKDLFLSTTYLPAFNLDQASIVDILVDLSRNPRKFLFGYASSLYLLAKTAVDLGFSTISFDYAVSWGDKLFPHYRDTIRQAFACETLDTYGCTEGAMIAAQCKEGQYHLSVNQCYIEIVDDEGRPVPAGTMGKVLATRLDNFAMPLIRYYLGDLAVLEHADREPCACRRQSPLLRQVIGRDTDIVATRSGKQMIVHFFTAIFEHLPQIAQFKVVQHNLDEMEIHYIPGNGFEPEVLTGVEAKIHEHLSERFPIRWEQTEKILPTKSGKPQIIQSFLKPTVPNGI